MRTVTSAKPSSVCTPLSTRALRSWDQQGLWILQTCLSNLADDNARENTLSHRGSLTLNWGVVADQSQSLHIGTNHIANAADFGVAVDFIGAGLSLVKTILQGFDCDIESDFVPKFETVGDGLSG